MLTSKENLTRKWYFVYLQVSHLKNDMCYIILCLINEKSLLRHGAGCNEKNIEEKKMCLVE